MLCALWSEFCTSVTSCSNTPLALMWLWFVNVRFDVHMLCRFLLQHSCGFNVALVFEFWFWMWCILCIDLSYQPQLCFQPPSSSVSYSLNCQLMFLVVLTFLCTPSWPWHFGNLMLQIGVRHSRINEFIWLWLEICYSDMHLGWSTALDVLLNICHSILSSCFLQISAGELKGLCERRV